MKQNKILGIAALSIIAILGVSIVSAFGFGNGFWNSNLSDEEKTEMQEQRQEMKTAVENNDFSLWKSLMEQRIEQMKSKLTEENFNLLTQRHQEREEFRTAMEEARESGDFSEMKELREQFGEGNGLGKGMRAGFGKGMGNCPMSE